MNHQNGLDTLANIITRTDHDKVKEGYATVPYSK